ncbi:MAG: DNA-protecting protein DprA, partial [Parasphingopyxis sp.]
MAEPADASARLRLARSHNIGPVTYARLMARFGDAARAIEAIPDLARRGGGRAPKLADPAAIETERQAGAPLGARHLVSGAPPHTAGP